jgi:small subunit ribosomal protein S16
MRRGRKKLALFDIVVADARSPRDGRFIQKLGTYNPNSNPAGIELDHDKTLDWLIKGAQPTDTVRRILSYKGIMLQKHLQVGVNKGAITQEEADRRFQAWLDEKAGKISGKKDHLARSKAEADKARFEAERKIKEAREEALRQKRAEASAELAGAALGAASEAAEAIAEIEGAPESADSQVEATPEVAEEAVSPVEAASEVAEEAASPVEAVAEAAEEAVSPVDTAAETTEEPVAEAPKEEGTPEEEK